MVDQGWTLRTVLFDSAIFSSPLSLPIYFIYDFLSLLVQNEQEVENDEESRR